MYVAVYSFLFLFYVIEPSLITLFKFYLYLINIRKFLVYILLLYKQ